jgi:hypothetical protein
MGGGQKCKESGRRIRELWKERTYFNFEFKFRLPRALARGSIVQELGLSPNDGCVKMLYKILSVMPYGKSKNPYSVVNKNQNSISDIIRFNNASVETLKTMQSGKNIAIV